MARIIDNGTRVVSDMCNGISDAGSSFGLRAYETCKDLAKTAVDVTRDIFENYEKFDKALLAYNDEIHGMTGIDHDDLKVYNKAKALEMLDKWFDETSCEKKEIVKARIEEFIHNKAGNEYFLDSDSFLQLRDCSLTSDDLEKIIKIILCDRTVSDRLKYLELDDNELTSLPESLGQLSALKILTLDDNQLTSLPEEILNLNQNCSVQIENNNLFPRVIENLRTVTSAPEYRGPTIFYSIRENENLEQKPSEEIIKDLYLVAEKKEKTFTNLLNNTNAQSLNSWLNRLSYMKDFKCGDIEKKKWLANNIIKYLELAEEDEEFRITFFNAVIGASATCGDRMALSILYLGVQCKIDKCDKEDIKALSELLKTVQSLDLLEKCAKAKVDTLRFVDEIEVHLGYPVKLKKDLNLQIDVDDMLYFSCSAIKDEELEAAKEFVKEAVKGDSFNDFLIEQPVWLEALKMRFKERFKQLEQMKDFATENGDQNAYNKYKNGLKELSKEVL